MPEDAIDRRSGSPQERLMKSQFRCILFALIALPAACGSEHPASTPSKPASVDRTPVPPPTAVAPAPVAPEVKPPVAEVVPVAPVPVAPTTFSEAIAQGKAAVAHGDHARARELFEAAVKLDKKSAEPHIELTRLFVATGERGLAMAA